MLTLSLSYLFPRMPSHRTHNSDIRIPPTIFSPACLFVCVPISHGVCESQRDLMMMTFRRRLPPLLQLLVVCMVAVFLLLITVDVCHCQYYPPYGSNTRPYGGL